MRLFGTNGIREVVGERLTPEFAVRVATAIGTCFPPGPPIALGWDGRTSSPALADLVAGTLALLGHRVVRLGVLPTPAIQYSVPRLQAQLGVIVTASHNPPEFNGLKCIASDGLEVVRAEEERIEAAVVSGTPTTPSFERIGEIHRDDRGGSRYLDGILACVKIEPIVRRGFSVVLDCGNGAGSVTSPTLLRRLGCKTVTLNGHLDGTFPGRRSEPTRENLTGLCRAVPAVGADLGIAHDGDADRAVFVDAAGTFIPGEKILALLARDRVRRHGGGVVVTPVTGSQAIEDVVRAEGGELVYTRVGSPAVTREMQRRSALFGGEENGGLIFPEFQLARDGGMAAAAVLDYLAREQVSLADALKDLPSYFLVKRSINCPVELRDRVMSTLETQLRAWGDRLVTLDGIKAYRSTGWVLVRPSGTEPILRVFAEARDLEASERLASEGVAAVRKAIGTESGAHRGTTAP